jgi:molybdenum cofactor guanylyltransferase
VPVIKFFERLDWIFMKSIIILCGGRGRRMGQDKGLIIFQDKPLLHYILDTVKNVVEEIIIVLRDEYQLMEYKKILKDFDFNSKNFSLCTDLIKDQGPLMGIYTGLKQVHSNRALVVPCDSPYITPKYVENIFNIADEVDAIVPQWSDGRIEPLHSIYKKEVDRKIKTFLDDGKRDVRSILEVIRVKYVPVEQLDNSKQSFMNLNYPDDLDK